MIEPLVLRKHAPACVFKDFPYTALNDKSRGRILIISKITSKAQTTVPRSVRAALKLGVGDTIVYAIEGDHVVMTKATAPTIDSPTAAFEEWNSENDRHAYAGL